MPTFVHKSSAGFDILHSLTPNPIINSRNARAQSGMLAGGSREVPVSGPGAPIDKAAGGLRGGSTGWLKALLGQRRDQNLILGGSPPKIQLRSRSDRMRL